MGGSDSCYIFGCSSDEDILTASNTDAKRPETRTGHFARLISSSRFDKIHKLDRDYSYWQILSLVCPLEYHVALFLSINPKIRSVGHSLLLPLCPSSSCLLFQTCVLPRASEPLCPLNWRLAPGTAMLLDTTLELTIYSKYREIYIVHCVVAFSLSKSKLTITGCALPQKMKWRWTLNINDAFREILDVTNNPRQKFH